MLINNAGAYVAPEPVTREELDLRFAVNTIALSAYTAPHPDALDPRKSREIFRVIESFLADLPNLGQSYTHRHMPVWRKW